MMMGVRWLNPEPRACCASSIPLGAGIAKSSTTTSNFSSRKYPVASALLVRVRESKPDELNTPWINWHTAGSSSTINARLGKRCLASANGVRSGTPELLERDTSGPWIRDGRPGFIQHFVIVNLHSVAGFRLRRTARLHANDAPCAAPKAGVSSRNFHRHREEHLDPGTDIERQVS